MKTYRSYIEMTFEPDENGYLEWEDEYGLTPEELAEEELKPRTEEQMIQLFREELWEYIFNNIKYSDVTVDGVQVEQL